MLLEDVVYCILCQLLQLLLGKGSRKDGGVFFCGQASLLGLGGDLDNEDPLSLSVGPLPSPQSRGWTLAISWTGLWPWAPCWHTIPKRLFIGASVQRFCGSRKLRAKPASRAVGGFAF